MPFLDLVMFSTKVKETALEKGECLTHAHWFILHMQPWLSPCQLTDCLFTLRLSSSCSSRPPLIHVLFGVSISLFSLTFFLICLQGSDTKIFTFFILSNSVCYKKSLNFLYWKCAGLYWTLGIVVSIRIVLKIVGRTAKFTCFSRSARLNCKTIKILLLIVSFKNVCI